MRAKDRETDQKTNETTEQGAYSHAYSELRTPDVIVDGVCVEVRGTAIEVKKR